MTISELIDNLKQFPMDMPVVRRCPGEHVPRWQTMDGYWFQTVDVVPSSNPLNAGDYREAKGREGEEGIVALEL